MAERYTAAVRERAAAQAELARLVDTVGAGIAARLAESFEGLLTSQRAAVTAIKATVQ